MTNLSDAQRRVAELTTLNELAHTLNRSVDLREMLETGVRLIVELMGLRSGWISLREDAETFRLIARHDLPPAISYPGPMWEGDCHCQELCREGKLTKDVNLVPCSRLRHAVGDKRGLAQHATVPLRSDSEILGVLNVAMGEFGRLTQAQTQMLAALGHMLGTAIARSRLHDQVTIRQVQEQATLLQLSQDLLGASSLEPALQRLVRVGARLLEVEACAFVEADEAQGYATLLAAHGWRFLPAAGLPAPLDETNPHLWYLPERSANLPDEALDDLPPLLKAQRFQGHLGLSVTIGGVPVGTLMVNTRAPRTFMDDEAQLLGLLGSQLAQTLERERLHQEALARQRLEQELELGREIQASFLPDCCPNIPGYDTAAFYRAARQVGGDFYDFIDLPAQDDPAQERRTAELEFWRTGRPSGRLRGRPTPPPRAIQRLGIVIADVTDKGVPAALFMVLSRTLLRATASDGRAPRAMLEQANRLILADTRSGMFVTTFYCILDVPTGALTYGNGGHNYPLVYRAATDQVEQLQAQGIVLGIIPDPRFEEHTTTIHPGDVLCFYTDGVTEAMNARRQLFDEARLAEVLRRSHHLPAEQIITRIIEAVTNFAAGHPQVDDITLVVMKRER